MGGRSILSKLATSLAIAHLLPLGLPSCAPETTAPHPQQTAALVVEARLIYATPIPDLARIAPYRRALTTALFQVTEVRKGELPDPKILVARWAIVDDLPIPVLALQPGTNTLLHLVRMDAREDLRDQMLLDETGEFDLPLYFALAETILPPNP